MNVKSRSKRLYFRYSLRTLLVVVTLACVVLGLYVKRLRDRHIAIETIKEWGGVVEFADPSPTIGLKGQRDRLLAIVNAYQVGEPRPEFPENLPQGAGWQRRMFGKYGKYLGTSVQAIYLSRNSFTPEGAKIDLRVLRPLTEVNKLVLRDFIDDRALQRLPRLPKLETLYLEGDSNVGDDGMKCLSRMPNLKTLQVGGASLSGEGLAYISAPKGLTSVILYNCELTDDCLGHLLNLPNLSSLTLFNSSVGDEAVPDLVRLRGLQSLTISGTKVTAEGVAQLREALPNCRIVSEFR